MLYKYCESIRAHYWSIWHEPDVQPCRIMCLFTWVCFIQSLWRTLIALFGLSKLQISPLCKPTYPQISDDISHLQLALCKKNTLHNFVSVPVVQTKHVVHAVIPSCSLCCLITTLPDILGFSEMPLSGPDAYWHYNSPPWQSIAAEESDQLSSISELKSGAVGSTNSCLSPQCL